MGNIKMIKKPKLVAVGDELLSPDIIKEKLEPLLPDWEILTCWFGPRDLGALDEILVKVEHYGPEVVDEPEELHQYLQDADVLLVHMCPVSEKLLEQYPNLVAVGVLRGGTENIDSEAAKRLGIPVFHTRGRTTEGVSDFAIGMMLTEVRNIARTHAKVLNGEWPKEFPNSVHIPEMHELTIGIIGFGEIGQMVNKKLKGFESTVQVFDPFVPSSFIEESGASAVSLETLLKTSDIITLHARYTAGMKPILGKKELEIVKPNSYIINTARAGLLDMDVLVEKLQEGKIMGAAIDVFEKEPIDRDHPILRLHNVTLTSHIAFDTASFYKRSPVLWWNGVENALYKNNTRSCINDGMEVSEKVKKFKTLLVSIK